MAVLFICIWCLFWYFMLRTEGDIGLSAVSAFEVFLLIFGSAVCIAIARFFFWSASTNDQRLKEYNERKRL